MIVTQRFQDAFTYACIAHGGQMRKGKEVPYLAHLLGVASLVLEFGGTESEAMAALLHDVVEDAGGRGRLADVTARFGNDVAAIVESCSDSVLEGREGPKAPWRERKQSYIAAVTKKTVSARLVSCADKVHNLSDILRDCRRHGIQTLDRFSAPPTEILWYYRALSDAFRTSGTRKDLVDELDLLINQLAALI